MACTVEVADSLDGLPADARAFLAEAERQNIEFGLGWYRNLIDTVYPAHAGLRFYVLRGEDGRIGALLPLRGETEAGAWRWQALRNFYTSLYQPLLRPGLQPSALLPLLAALARERPRWASLTLAPMDPASPAYQVLLAALRLQGWRPYQFFSFGNWYQPVGAAWADYLTARPGVLRSTIKRAGKKFAAAGGELEMVTGGDGMARAIAAYETVYAASWKQPEPFPAFMPGLLRSCAEHGHLRLGLAWLGGQPIAAQLWIVCHGRAAIYKLAYHEDYKAYAPGTLLTAKLMQHVMETDRVSEVDYLIGDDDYKQSWMSERRERWGIVAYNPRSLAGVVGQAREVLSRAVKAGRRRWSARRPA